MFAMSENINELALALAKAQNEMPVAEKGSDGNWGTYSSYPEVIIAARPSLAKNNLSVTQVPYTKNGIIILKTILLHSSGQFISGELEIKPDKPGREKIASDMSYFKRHAFVAITGLACAEKDYDSDKNYLKEKQEDKSNKYDKQKKDNITKENLQKLEDYIINNDEDGEIAKTLLNTYKVSSFEELTNKQFITLSNALKI